MTATFETRATVRTSSDIIRAGSKSFAAASMLFAPEVRCSVHDLYAWCRHCDDVIDGQELGFASASRNRTAAAIELTTLRERTADALAGKPISDPVFRGLQAVMRKHRIPSVHAFELLDGFAMDVDARVYVTIEDTLSYCYHVAGAVGVMMAMIMGVRDETTLDRAADLGIGFQLTNVARDLVEDAAAGRCYLPRGWLVDVGLTPETMIDVAYRDKLAGLASRLVETAEGYYASSRCGLVQLPFRSRWAVGAARSVYRKIGRDVAVRGPYAWDARVSTSKVDKVAAVLVGCATAMDVQARGRFLSTTPRTGLWTRPKV